MVRCAVGLLVAFQMLSVSAQAQMPRSWSPPVLVDGSGSPGLGDVACPSASQCTAVDSAGREVTYDPGAPGSPSPVVVAPGVGLSSIACPSVSQCTAVALFNGAGSQEVTFDPRSPQDATSAGLPSPNGGGYYEQIACASASQCTAVFEGPEFCSSGEVTFDPQAPGSPRAVVIDQLNPCPISERSQPGPALAIACPSASQCVAVGSDGREVTFDPVSPGSPTPVTIDSNGLTAVGCPSASECVAVDGAGREVVFDPDAPGSPTPVAVDSNALQQLACVSASQCTAVDTTGAEVTFNPAAPGAPTPVSIGSVVNGTGITGIACPSASLCTAVDYNDGIEVTFNPTSAATRVATTVDRGSALESIACPAASQCTALDGLGAEVTFDPASHQSPSRSQIASAGNLSLIACPSASLCVASAGYPTPLVALLLVFDPASPARVSRIQVPAGYGLTGLACPSVSRCVTVEYGVGQGQEETFDPTSPGEPAPTAIDVSGPSAVACPTVSQCTAVGDGGEVTFNPASPGSAMQAVVDPQGASLVLIACPSISQCTAIDDAGNEVTFNPASPANATLVSIDAMQRLTVLVCPAVSTCLAVDGDNGDVIEGDPTGGGAWTTERIAGVDSLTSISCPVVWQCVAGDSVGNAFVGMPSPRLTRVRESHRTWRERSRLGRHHRGRPTPLGTVFSFALNEQAHASFTFTESLPGRRVGHRCAAVTQHDRHHRPCTRTIVLGTLPVSAAEGQDRVSFGGRLSPSRRLSPGRYTLLIAAVNATGQRSMRRSLTFTIVR